jgi:hypothetical protein
MDPSSGSGAGGTGKSELKNQELVVGAWRFELQTSCAQGNCKKSISLVRLALFCVVARFWTQSVSIWTQMDPSSRQKLGERRLNIGLSEIIAFE